MVALTMLDVFALQHLESFHGSAPVTLQRSGAGHTVFNTDACCDVLMDG